MKKIFVMLVSICVLFGGIGSASAVLRYDVIDLGDLPGGDDYSFSQSINNAGQVTGVSDTEFGGDPNNGKRAFIWDVDSGMTNIGAVPGEDWTSRSRINSAGNIVGTYWNHARAFTWDATNGKQMLNVPGTMPYYGARDINDDGDILATNWNYDGSQAVSYIQRNDVWTSIPALTTTPYMTFAEAVNNHDQIVGWGRVGGVGSTSCEAFVWDETGGTRSLPTLGGTRNHAYDINDAGQIVGCATIAGDEAQQAVLWSGDTITDLSAPGVIGSYANAINTSGDMVVGGLTTAAEESHAFLYTEDAMLDLNDFIDPGTEWTLLVAYDVNDSGWIIGDGLNAEGANHGFVLVPSSVPIPSAIWLLGSGLIGLVGVRRKFRKS